MFMPEKRHKWPPAPCAEFENQILDLLHGQLSEPVRCNVEAHLAACPACCQFAEELESLDAALTAEFQGKVLPASFKTTLLSRVDTAAAGAAPDVIARRKEAIESEFQRQSVGLLRRVVRENWGLFLDGAGLVTLAIVVALLVPKLASGGISNRGLMPESLPTQAATYLLWALAAFAVAGAFWFGFRDKARALVP